MLTTPGVTARTSGATLAFWVSGNVATAGAAERPAMPATIAATAQDLRMKREGLMEIIGLSNK
jgi:hypothetical protein